MTTKEEAMIRRYPLALKSIKHKLCKIDSLERETTKLSKQLAEMRCDRDLYRGASLTIFEEARKLSSENSNFSVAWLMNYIARKFAAGLPFIW